MTFANRYEGGLPAWILSHSILRVSFTAWPLTAFTLPFSIRGMAWPRAANEICFHSSTLILPFFVVAAQGRFGLGGRAGERATVESGLSFRLSTRENLIT